MSPCHCQCQPDQDTVLQSKIHAYIMPRWNLYTNLFLQEPIVVGTRLVVANMKYSLSHNIILAIIINEMQLKMTCSHSREFVFSYVHSVHSRLQDGGAG